MKEPEAKLRLGFSNKTVGQAGEFAVCAQLGKRGLIATPFSGNVPDYDVVVCDDQLRVVPLQVKASLNSGSWILGDARYWLVIDIVGDVQTVLGPNEISHPSLIYCFVQLMNQGDQVDRFYLLTKAELQSVVMKQYTTFLARHNGVRPRNPRSTHCAIFVADLAPFEGRWDLIVSKLAAANVASLQAPAQADS